MIPARANPFRSERVTSLPWRAQGPDLGRLWTRLAHLGGRAAIVGPHGTGKTTLLEALVDDAPRRGYAPRLVRLAEARRHPTIRVLAAACAAGPGALVAVDGSERMSAPGLRLLAAASRRASRLLVTAHHPGPLPTLIATATNPELLARLVDELAPGELASLEPILPELFRRHSGNLRACLGELYDRAAGRATGPAPD